MSGSALAIARRRGACPGLSTPLPTGDGLLVRLRPVGTIALPAFATLCDAARRHGNGIIEITARGSIQMRGLSTVSAPDFADAIAALGIAAGDGVPVLSDPLSGLDAVEIFDAGALAAELRRALAKTSLPARLSPKVSVVIDGGGALSLDVVGADVRLYAESEGAMIRIAVGGDGATAAELGLIEPSYAVDAVVRLLEVLAIRGRNAHARDVVANEGMDVFHSPIADFFVSVRTSHKSNSSSRVRERKDAIGQHHLHDGRLACGIGLAFGHTDANSLEQLTKAAAIAGANGLRTAPDRTLMAIGFPPETVSDFIATAAQLGFIVRKDDPRRRVIACAGAPICASAYIESRTLAPLIAGQSPFTIHLSGCAKGCARAAPAPLTVVGTPDGCALVANGSARDAPLRTVPVDKLRAAIIDFAREHHHV